MLDARRQQHARAAREHLAVVHAVGEARSDEPGRRWRFSPAGHGLAGRVQRFALTGATAAVVQLVVLRLLLELVKNPAAGNVVAFLAASQVNFALSQWFTWRERSASGSTRARWARFMSAISSTALVNLGTFAIASLFIPALPAAALGIGVAACLNFVVADRLVFVDRTRTNAAGEAS